MAVGFQRALSELGWDVETSSGPTAADVVDHAQRFQPQCALLDIHLGRGIGSRIGSGIDLIGPLVSTGARVVMLTAERRRTVLAECLEAGAAGWIGIGAALDEVDATLDHLLTRGAIVGRTDRAALLHALRLERTRAMRAQTTFEQLTQREALVLAAMTDGLGAQEIAREHFVALTTVRSQIRAVLQKLGVNSQLAAVAVAAAHPELLPERGQAEHDRRRSHDRHQGYRPELSAITA